MVLVSTLDERLHRTALKAALSSVTVYDPDEVPGSDGNPGTPSTPFVVLYLERMPGSSRKAGRDAHSLWRVITACAGDNADEVDDAELKVAAALEGLRITVDGTVSTPLLFDISEAIEPPAGVLYARRSERTYVL